MKIVSCFCNYQGFFTHSHTCGMFGCFICPVRKKLWFTASIHHVRSSYMTGANCPFVEMSDGCSWLELPLTTCLILQPSVFCLHFVWTELAKHQERSFDILFTLSIATASFLFILSPNRLDMHEKSHRILSLDIVFLLTIRNASSFVPSVQHTTTSVWNVSSWPEVLLVVFIALLCLIFTVLFDGRFKIRGTSHVLSFEVFVMVWLRFVFFWGTKIISV